MKLNEDIDVKDIKLAGEIIERLAKDHGTDRRHIVMRLGNIIPNGKIFDFLKDKTYDQVENFMARSSDKILQAQTHAAAGTGWQGALDSLWNSKVSFTQWLSANIAKGFNDDNDLMIKAIRYIVPDNYEQKVIDGIRGYLIDNPNAPGVATTATLGAGATLGAANTSAGQSLLKWVSELLGFGGENNEKAAEAAESDNKTLWYAALGAGLGAGALWLFNKFKKNPRSRLTPQEIVYAAQLNERIPNYNRQNG